MITLWVNIVNSFECFVGFKLIALGLWFVVGLIAGVYLVFFGDVGLDFSLYLRVWVGV